jgi:uncharacterized protein YceH (UPF0502 family)
VALEGLARRELVARRPRRPGQKEDRYAQLLGDASAQDTAAVVPQEPPRADRLAQLEARVEMLELEVEALRGRLSS